MMFDWLKPKKAYCVIWRDIWDNCCRDLVRAKDAVEAWQIIKQGHYYTAKDCISAVEINPKSFNVEKK